jgi:enamine deaminase RidA (YjgF/YER057c/UK114 family)
VRKRLADEGGFGQVAGYSRAVRQESVVAVSATAALEDGRVLHEGDAYGQARVALDRALEAAGELGAGIEDVLRTRLLLAPGCDWRAVVRAHEETFAGRPPANTTYYVGGLIPPGALVEVEIDAYARVPDTA